MKLFITRCILVILSIIVFMPSDYTEAASSTSVKTKVFSYQGQKYVQISGGNKKIAEKVNKVLKNHAVAASKSNVELKKDSKSNFYLTSPNTKFNKNGLLSIVYTDSAYTGGAHELYWASTYNFDLTNGNLITLGHVVKNDDQIKNLVVSVSAGLNIQKNSGVAIFDENIFDFPISPDSSFYFYESGIVIRFSPYEVAPFSEGFVDVKVPYVALNAKPFTSDNNLPLTPAVPSTSKIVESTIDDDFEGYDEGNLYELSNGQIWKQVEYEYSYTYSYRPEVIIYKDGSRYYMKVEGMTDKVQVERIK